MILLVFAILAALVLFCVLRQLFFPAVILVAGILGVQWFEHHTGICLTDHCAQVKAEMFK
jgi:hypothetical protein